MRRITSIVALNLDGAIGCRNALPWRLRTDMAFFREETRGNIVIMGRKTYDSLGRKPLPGRFNIILSHHFGLLESAPDLAGATGIAEALAVAETAPDHFREIFIVGGQTMYEQFAPLVDRYLITVVNKSVANADTFFDKNLIESKEWQSHLLRSVEASEGVDEASFTIEELTRERTGARLESRQQMIDTVILKKPARLSRRPSTYKRTADERLSLNF
ncbi:hypothetical protein BH09PSE3_BH09PSE3_17720 [soil metagenome]